MKIIITESQNKNLKLSLKQIIKSVGIESAFQSVGEPDILFQILDINSPRDYLNLFNDLDVVQSEEEPDLTLFRYRPKHNILIYDRKNEYVYISSDEIWGVLQSNFGLNRRQIKGLTEEWLGEVYNLRGITPYIQFFHKPEELGEVYNLRGITPPFPLANNKVTVV